MAKNAETSCLHKVAETASNVNCDLGIMGQGI